MADGEIRKRCPKYSCVAERLTESWKNLANSYSETRNVRRLALTQRKYVGEISFIYVMKLILNIKIS